MPILLLLFSITKCTLSWLLMNNAKTLSPSLDKFDLPYVNLKTFDQPLTCP